MHCLNTINDEYDHLSRRIDLSCNNEVKETVIVPNTNVTGVSTEAIRTNKINESLNEELKLRLDSLEQHNNIIALENRWHHLLRGVTETR